VAGRLVKGAAGSTAASLENLAFLAVFDGAAGATVSAGNCAATCGDRADLLEPPATSRAAAGAPEATLAAPLDLKRLLRPCLLPSKP
jgi:hypothetical protein